jgi:hypothetical protein
VALLLSYSGAAAGDFMATNNRNNTNGATVAANGSKGSRSRTNAKPPTPAAPPEKSKANIFCWPLVLQEEFVEKVKELEKALDKEVWLLLQGGVPGAPYSRIDFQLLDRFMALKSELPKPDKNGSRLALLIHSPGGYAEPAYKMARLFQRRCKGFTAVVPRYAMSAATLLSLGADSIILGDEAELGPLDAQFFDYDVAETMVSALDEVQAVEALEQSATETAYKVMVYLQERTGKSFNVLMPQALRFAADITKPLFEKVDAVRYSRQSRRLQEAQDYAERLLRPRFSDEDAKRIAHDLVRRYPTHEFVIDRREAQEVGRSDGAGGDAVGLHIEKLKPEVGKLLDWFYSSVVEIRAIGRLSLFKPGG